MPDWSTLTPLPYAPGHARVMGDMVLAGRPSALCPRDFLRRASPEPRRWAFRSRLPSRTSSTCYAGRWYTSSRSTTPFSPPRWAWIRHGPIIDDVAEALLAQNVPVVLYHPESGPGQQELSIHHAGPLEAANRQIVFRETVHAVADRHGVIASFLPKVFADRAGSGSTCT